MEQGMEEKVTLVADGQEFLCSKEKLIASSDYFRAMFSNNFSEKDKNIIKLESIDGASLKILLEYAQTGTYYIPSDDTLALLQTAAMLQFTTIQLACESQVFGSLSCESCLDIYSVTALLGLSNIAKSARTIAVWNFRKIITMPKYLQLSFEALVEYLIDPSLYTGPNGEWTVWEAILSWIQCNDLERASHIKELLRCIDFKLLTADDISNLLFYPVVSENDVVVQILESIRKYKRDRVLNCKPSTGSELQASHVCNNSETNLDVNSQLESADFYLNCLTRRKALSPSVVGFKRLHSKKPAKAKNSDDEDDYGNIVSKRNLDLVPVLYTFDQNNGKLYEEFSLTKLCHGPVLCSGYQVCSVGPSVYVLGGEFQYGHGNWNLSLWRFSTATKKWIVENSLPKPRRHHMICVVDTIIFLLGGFGKHRVVQSSVTAYDTESGEWLSCPDMPHCVSHGAVCSFKGRVMLFTREMQLLTYYPSMKKWSAVPLRSPSKHGYRAAVAWKNFIYLVDNCSTKVYKYSPEECQTVVEYGSFASPPINVCIVDGKIYNFSHDDLDNHVIEVLDIEDQNVRQNSHARHRRPVTPGEKCSESNVTSDDVQSELAELKEDGCVPAAIHSVTENKDVPQIITSREVWREGDDGPHLFTTKYPADSTFSVGCFALMKL